MDKQDYYKGQRSYKTVDYGIYDDTRYLLDGVHLTCHNQGVSAKAVIHDNHCNVYKSITYPMLQSLERRLPKRGYERKLLKKVACVTAVPEFRDKPNNLIEL